MAIFTVHAPPRADQSALDAERFVFIRDGFHLWAMLFAPLWMLRWRLWLVLLIYVLGVSAVELLLWLLSAPAQTHFLVEVLIALLIGFEAATLRRWTLRRRGWIELDVVGGENTEAAERRFFDGWVASADAQPPAAPPPPAAPIRRPLASDIIGLFPEPLSRQ
jgi:Protein of unknown function (DUF2628)